MKKLNKKFKTLYNKVLDITFKHELSHLSSCLTTLPILFHIYETKSENDVVILSNGHAGLAQYVCQEAYEGKDAEYLLTKHGIHPTKDSENNIFCSTGSLGLGLPIAIGAALADNTRHVHCIISDGECCEGSIWESLYFLTKVNVPNLNVYVNANGISAYDNVNIQTLKRIITSYKLKNVTFVDTSKHLTSVPYLNEKGIEAHYVKITSEETLNNLKLY